MTPRDKFMNLKMHFDGLKIYATPWNKFKDLKMHFKSSGT